MRNRLAFRHWFRAFASLAFFALVLCLAFYITAFVYARTGWKPHAVLALLVNAFLGIILMVALVAIAGTVIHRRHRTKNPLSVITEALERIATGDFTTRLDENLRSHGVVGELVQSVNHMATRLDEMEKLRQEFVSNVSHEIQSPLTSIRGFAAALQRDNVSLEDRLHYLEIIEAESLRLSRLSENLLKLASLDSEQTRLAPTTYRLDVQLRNLILACETQWTAKDIEMEVALDEAAISADEDLLSQVWINLIHNSIKFTPPGGTIHVGLHRKGDRWEVSVADTGIGIAEEDLPRIFERFYKADPSRRHSAGGNGLGLAIAQRVVEIHSGAIAVRSQPGAGAEFTVSLPAV
ncbi:sensor histidine kinase [Paludibaculum fermentans]|uniref:histidine kinase n=1 Tax=Paludibaculum fermentans TaxID=1473598 RepID=A0A7S7NLV8_PALFE|nr:HAMP domain-containing sensor histidine kinase [Paludibaculum fermentans]QOY86011.1 HAMP domain-containing protein [Paludibaculum fermentans]